MKIKNHINLEQLQTYGYEYREHIAYPTYTKVRTFGSQIIIIEIVIQTRKIYINKSAYINQKNRKFIEDLIQDNLVEKEK